MSDTPSGGWRPPRLRSAFQLCSREELTLPSGVTTPTMEFLSPISQGHLTLTAGAATWREALQACSRCARGIQFRTRRTRRRCQVALHTQRAARTLLSHPARRPTPHLQRVGLTGCGRLPLHRSIRKSCALDTYESTEDVSYHPTFRPSPRDNLEMRWVSHRSRTPRCSSRCCCWAPLLRTCRPGNGGNGPERRRRRGGDAPGAWCGRGRAEKPRRGGRLEWFRA